MEDNLKEIVRDITKNYENSDDSHLAEHLVKYYYLNYYNGTELDKVSSLYFDRIWLELLFWVGKNSSYLKQNKKGLKKVNKFFEKEILKAKIGTINIRKNLFYNWLGGKKNLENEELNTYSKEILSVLLQLLPKINEANIKDAKIMLGLNEKKEDLEKQLKEINNE